MVEEGVPTLGSLGGSSDGPLGDEPTEGSSWG